MQDIKYYVVTVTENVLIKNKKYYLKIFSYDINKMENVVTISKDEYDKMMKYKSSIKRAQIRYLEKEENLQKYRDFSKKYYQKNREKILEKHKQKRLTDKQTLQSCEVSPSVASPSEVEQ